ncbi:hypothetical protein B0J14DRAFT_605343 [Halenospora varia]|nr:hypothetical protein B0J14DRAFT_605343 [Halenospora varia]
MMATSPARPSTLSFFSLSREIRDKIYEFALASSSPLSAWSGAPLRSCCKNWQWDHRGLLHQFSKTSSIESKDDSLMLRRTLRSLLRCNSKVSCESAQIYYGKNTFRFCDLYDWEDVSIWLQDIGCTNRGYLTKMEFLLPCTNFVRQNSEGIRGESVRVDGKWSFTSENTRQRHPLLNQELGTISDSSVEDIDPEVETIFQFLGKSTDPSKVTIKILLAPWTVPGFRFLEEDYDSSFGLDESWFTMDLPNLMEVFRVKYNEGVRVVDILWTGIERSWVFEKHSDEIEAAGWEIAKDLEPVKAKYIEELEAFWPTEQLTLFALRRKAIIGPLIASEPGVFC